MCLCSTKKKGMILILKESGLCVCCTPRFTLVCVFRFAILRFMTREEMIQLVRNLSSGEGSEAEMTAWLGKSERSVPYVSWQNLIFWPQGFPHDPTKPEMRSEEIVDKALSSKPNVIIMPPPASE
jgi:hypothetical protein